VLRLTAGTMASRVLGLVREMVAMAYFGASGVFDAFVAASTLPNLFRDVLGEHAAESAFMPAHRTLVLRGRGAEARRLATSVLTIVVVSGLVLSVLGAVLAPWVVRVLAPRFAAERPDLLALAVSLARAMMPFLLIIAVGAVFGSLLLGERRFLRYALAPVGSSVCVIGAIVLLTGRLDAGSLAVGVVVGGVVQMAICAAPYLRRGGGEVVGGQPRLDLGQPALRQVGRSVVPIALSGVLNKFIWVTDRILANWFCAAGRLTALYMAHRLLQLPFGVLGLAVGRAAFPSLIEGASSREGERFSREVVRALRLNVFLMLPATVGLVVLAVPFVGVMFERGRFTGEHTRWVALALGCYAVGLVGMGMRTVLSRAFYALLNTRTPLVLSAIAIGANLVLNVALVVTPLGHGGLALASSLATWLQVVLLVVMLRREMARQGRALSLAGLPWAVGRMAASAAAMAAATWGCLAVLRAVGAGGGVLWHALCLVVPGGVGVAVYFGVALVLRCEEVAQVLRRLGGGSAAD
jgi:putative peptidoglycan lipid II flippase